MKLNLPEYILFAIDRLNSFGYQAYAVGGCIRDIIMGVEPNDYDICTNALPDKVKSVFQGYRTIETGIKHGTVSVVFENEAVEITTFRNETAYSDGRHPDSVSFSASLTEDLARRDFTVNALAYDGKNMIIDPYNGLWDIEHKIIKCVGNPEKRFNEDYLRILRAFRFACVLGFSVDSSTESAMKTMKSLIPSISGERISSELKKSICGDFFEKVFINQAYIVTEFIPELKPCIDYNQNNPHHDFDLLTHLAKTVSFCPKNPAVRLAALFHDIGKPNTMSKDENGISHYHSHARISADIAEKILRRLRFSKAEISHIITLIKHHDGVIEETEKAVAHKLNKIGIDAYFELISLQRADCSAQKSSPSSRSKHFDNLIKIAENIISQNKCITVTGLAVNGRDIMALGLKEKDIGNALSFLLHSVIDGDVENKKSDMLLYLKTNFLKHS